MEDTAAVQLRLSLSDGVETVEFSHRLTHINADIWRIILGQVPRHSLEGNALSFPVNFRDRLLEDRRRWVRYRWGAG